MARTRRKKNVALNTNLMIDTAIASLIVQKAPAILNAILFKENPLTGQAATVLGVGGAYAYGLFFNNSNVANIGITLGALDFVTPLLDSALESVGLTPAMNITQLPAGNGATAAPVEDYFKLSDYGRLNEYTNRPGDRMNYDSYKDSY